MLARKVLSILIFLGFGFLTQPLRAQAVLDTVCAGARGVTYRVLDNPGSSYQWSLVGGTIIDGNGSNEIVVEWGKDTGVFPIEVTQYSAQGCPGEPVRAFVWVRGGIDVQVTGPNVICEGDELTLNASGAKNLRWEGYYASSTLKIRPTETTEYKVIGYSEQCGMDTARFLVQVKKRPKAEILINPDDPRINEFVNFYNNGAPGTTEAHWNINNGRIVEEGENIQKRFDKSGNYSVQLVVVDPNGCADTAVTFFEIKVEAKVFIPNAFSPNGDGLNDVFAPEISDINFVRLQVFDRWGTQVFDGENYAASWDGSFKGEMVPEGVYVYIVDAIGLDNKRYTYNGTLTVIK
ncbi:MAG: gliding motility-associated C-terminal domain-containing protein [Bacteroidota bacterium]|nr:gliding motility-associated C-terminal domain-containing protein [Bacteroidota bacterium]MDX5430595.1 gliding motility-associated C-terminal domain-containing protein [Bacteroidota bacterium]MDX5469347.1 gliding motility-associated C-terminal domain-containing protein [Bacteroidota bacterium]